MNRLHEFVNLFGALRVLLVISVVALIIVAPFSDGPAHATGWPLVRSVIAPTLFVIMAFVLPLDITMTLIFMSESAGAGTTPPSAYRASRNRAARRDARCVAAPC